MGEEEGVWECPAWIFSSFEGLTAAYEQPTVGVVPSPAPLGWHFPSLANQINIYKMHKYIIFIYIYGGYIIYL